MLRSIRKANDANGSRLTVKNGNSTQMSYTYNADARLATVGTAALKYNAFGQRSVQTVTGGGTHFIFGEGGMLLAEHTTQGALTRNYVYLNGRPLALVDGAGTVSYILGDQVGQPQKMLDGSGALSWHRVAGIFGDTVSQPVGATAANPLRFPGQQFDPLSALHYNYFRDYDPATGRYLETDPIGLQGGLNLYAYADANPINRIDPTGENPLVRAILNRLLKQLPKQIPKKGSPKPSPKWRPPTNPPSLSPKAGDLPSGVSCFRGRPTQQYPDGYWKIQKPISNGKQPLDPRTMKPGPP